LRMSPVLPGYAPMLLLLLLLLLLCTLGCS
jgi:hypothetical protein